jgi:hypothetical protein
VRPAVGALTNTVGLAQQEELLLPYLDQAGIYEEDFEGGPFSKSYYSVSINIYKQYGNYFVLGDWHGRIVDLFYLESSAASKQTMILLRT